MIRTFVVVAALAALLLTPGCQTLTGDASGPFSGTRSWVQDLRVTTLFMGSESSASQNALGVAHYAGALIDMPLCLAADTALLPFTGVAYLLAGPQPRSVEEQLLDPRPGVHGAEDVELR